jgi:hypothetical protein
MTPLKGAVILIVGAVTVACSLSEKQRNMERSRAVREEGFPLIYPRSPYYDSIVETKLYCLGCSLRRYLTRVYKPIGTTICHIVVPIRQTESDKI